MNLNFFQGMKLGHNPTQPMMPNQQALANLTALARMKEGLPVRFDAFTPMPLYTMGPPPLIQPIGHGNFLFFKYNCSGFIVMGCLFSGKRYLPTWLILLID